MDTALFYTFSTIAQTLAGAIALLGAFVLYCLQSLKEESKERSLSLLSLYREPNQSLIHEMHIKGEYDEVFEYTGQHAPDDLKNLEYLKLHRARLGDLLDLQHSLLATFKLSLCLTIGLIITAVIILPFTPIISSSICCTVITFVSGISWFVGCLVSYGVLTWKAIKQ